MEKSHGRHERYKRLHPEPLRRSHMSCALKRPMQVSKLVMMVPERTSECKWVKQSCRTMSPEHASQTHPRQVGVPSLIVLSIQGLLSFVQLEGRSPAEWLRSDWVLLTCRENLAVGDD